MNFSFLFILLLIVLGFTHKTLDISRRMLVVIVSVLILLAISYNVKEKFQAGATTSAIEYTNCNSSEDCPEATNVRVTNLDRTSQDIINSTGAFTNNDTIVNVKIEAPLLEIPRASFKGCTNLENVLITANITKIDLEAFGNCTKLKTINFSENSNLRLIREKAFLHCVRLNSITIPDSVDTIGDQAFSIIPDWNDSGTKAPGNILNINLPEKFVNREDLTRIGINLENSELIVNGNSIDSIPSSPTTTTGLPGTTTANGTTTSMAPTTTTGLPGTTTANGTTTSMAPTTTTGLPGTTTANGITSSTPQTSSTTTGLPGTTTANGTTSSTPQTSTSRLTSAATQQLIGTTNTMREEVKRYLLFDGSIVKNLLDYLDMEDDSESIVNRNIRSEIFNLLKK